MDIKERLVGLLQDGDNPVWCWFPDNATMVELVDYLLAHDVVPARHGSIIETIEDGHMKRVFSCCGTDFTKMTCWMTPKYCPNCGAKMMPQPPKGE